MNSFRDQKKFIEALVRYERKMDPKEREIFRLIVDRDKDEEDLDSLSFADLTELYTKYYVNREKKSLDDLFKKG
ncbi:MAG: hypothetical protein KKF62_04300 [Bacteroidetes bacterium]|nr:hypothetical protein [Bacteroidota bacterium]MBU1115666.1 hypothetical protein [Bacteroidota bacterium]MBU1799021.1 hypothetical protein [Bacteroidota bacterium]